MILKSLSLLNYKNFDAYKVDFNAKINCFVGQNGVGKTNILDAIYHLSFGKSYFNPVSSQNIKHNEDFFVVDGVYEKNKRNEKVIVTLKKGQKKVIKRNGKAYDRFSDHIGFIPLVIISPADRDLIVEGSEVRRKFIDGVISQSDKSYLKYLLNYSKILSQRNALLKYFAANRTFDESMLQVYDEQLALNSKIIYSSRLSFVRDFEPILKKYYAWMAGEKELVGIDYKSSLHENSMEILLRENLEKDKVLQYTSKGIHREDLIFNLHQEPINRVGSQGQQKSFVVALKLAVFDSLKLSLGIKPILLLDDIFDKLDSNRVEGLIRLVNEHHFGQIFITDTHSERTEFMIKSVNEEAKVFDLSTNE